MLTTKQRAALRSLASTEDTIMQVGKNGINENLIKTVSDALEARELIKIKVLESVEAPIKDIAEELGFCDVCHFSNSFKKYFGISPKQYIGKTQV